MPTCASTTHRVRVGAKLLAVLVARVCKGLVKADVLRRPLDDPVHRLAALLVRELVPKVLQADDDARVKALDGIEAFLLVAAQLVDVALAHLPQRKVESKVRRPAFHHLFKLVLALGGKALIVAVRLQALVHPRVACKPR